VGWVSEHAGPRAGLALGAIATLATGAGLLMAAVRRRRVGELVEVPGTAELHERRAA
jgi:hypothetical protein